MATLDLMSLARQMIAINTSDSRSDLALIEFLLPLCRAAGLETTLLQEETRDGVQQFNLVATRRPVDPNTLLLAAHADTVSPGDHRLWTATGGDPFALTEHQGLLFGLGVADVKLDLLCKILALERLKGVELRENVGVAVTYGEETGRHGARLLVRELRARDGQAVPRRILVGEPTRLRPCTTHKGYVEFRTEATDPAVQSLPPLPRWRILFTGSGAHSSQPHHGASANKACLDALALLSGWAVISVQGGDAVNKVAHRCEALVAGPDPSTAGILEAATAASGVSCIVEPYGHGSPALWSPDLARMLIEIHLLTREFERQVQTFEAPGFDPPYTTVNNGLVRLSPGHLSYVVDVRRIPGTPAAQMLDAHEAALRKLERLGTPRSGGLQLHTLRALESTPFHAASRSELLAALRAELRVQGLPPGPEMKSGTTEAPVYQEAGMDTVVFGPGGAAGNIHRPNEHVALADLQRCIDIYQGVVLRLCGN